MGQMRTTEGPYGITEAVSSDTVAGVRRPLAGGAGGGPIPNPLPVEVVPPEPIEFLEVIEHVEGGVFTAWPPNVVSWSVTCETGTVVLTGVTATGGDTTLHAVDDVGNATSQEQWHTVAHPVSIDASNGRALLNIQYR